MMKGGRIWMGRYIKTPDEVAEMLKTIRGILVCKKNVQINNKCWADGKVNKTRQYMAETKVTEKDIRNVISKLEVKHYSSTEDDVNPHFPNEEVWIFGIRANLVDKEEDFYIKLKIRELKGKKLLIMSFHPEEPQDETKKLRFPYKHYEEVLNKKVI